MIRKRLLVISILNALDGILTYIGLIFHLIKETNPLLNIIEPIYLLGIKLLLSLLTILFVIYKTTFTMKKLWNILTIVVLVAYSLTMCLHAAWIIMLLK